MIELPRITRALRAHTQLDKPRNLKPNVDPTKPIQVKKKNVQRYKTFSDIYNYIKQNEPDPTDILKLLDELKVASKLLTGDATDDMIEDATVLSLRMFLDQDIVMLKHLSQLRQMFGTVLNTTANKICEIVTKISESIDENTKEYIKTEEADKENVKLWGDHIQCHHIPYKPVKKPLAKLTSKPAVASAFVTDFSMKYDKQKAVENVAKVPKAPPEPKFGKSWLEIKVKELYENTSDISSIDILQSVITFLNSPRSNDELQNDMFELLGFDKFEFIQDILGHREDIINSLKAPPPGPSLAEIAAILPENKMPQYLCQVSVLSEQEKMLAKLVRKEEKKAKNRRNEEDEDEQEINIAQMRAKRLSELSKPVVPFSTSKSASNIDPILQKISYFQTKVQYPNVYDSSLDAKNSAEEPVMCVDIKLEPGYVYEEQATIQTPDLPPPPDVETYLAQDTPVTSISTHPNSSRESTPLLREVSQTCQITEQSIIEKEYQERKQRADERHKLELQILREQLKESKAKADLAEVLLKQKLVVLDMADRIFK